MKLNVGSGKRYEPNYINIDLYEGILADQQMSAINLKFPDNSCEEVKAIQLIEHLGFFKSLYALSEFFRVLQLDGILIIETPDIDKAFQSYLNGNYEQKKEILGWIFGIPHEGLQHKLCYPSELLVEILRKVGFNDIKEKRFYNVESIPSLKIECKKSSGDDYLNFFHIISLIRKRMLIDNIVNFKDSFLTKEQEDLLTFILLKLKEFEKEKDRDNIFEIIKTTLIRSPQITKIFLNVIDDYDYLSSLEKQYINEITEDLINYNLPNILYNSLKKAPIIPGTQKFVFSSIEAFGKRIIDKILFFRSEKQKQLTRLKELSNVNKQDQLYFFSQATIQRKSEEFFYIGIKEFFNQNYKNAKLKLLDSIQIFRDDFIYYWNLAKVFVRLNLKSDAIKFYRRTLRLLRISDVKNKRAIKKDIDSEISWLKKSKGPIPDFNPIISLDIYHSIN
ncbi:MAG: hypothetical protein KAW51_08390 [Candidatus Lokiarchaeota archaeon]|nr:hypothetical protein [Candidatus Lokiarchaeota archaeon]